MAEASIPYLNAYGNITRALEKIKKAQVPDRFSQDFLETTLDLSGGGARPVIPYMKRTGFLGSDGTPTELYKRFRNPAQAGSAAAEALRTGYADLYRANEYVHDASDSQLKGLIVQVTGLDADASSVKAMVASFKALRAYADFDAETLPPGGESAQVANVAANADFDANTQDRSTLRLGYTINLNLPATSDIAVFDAIFKSLKEHLL